MEAILLGPYIRLLGQAKPNSDSENILLKHPRFDTLRDGMDVLKNTNIKYNQEIPTEFETGGQKKCHVTPEFLPSDTSFESDSS